MPFIKAVPMPEIMDMADPAGPLERVKAIPPSVTPLLDAHDPIKRGGTGHSIDWIQAATIASARPIVLSGGLTAGNIQRALETVHPYAVDVSSGVESSPGVKDAGKLRDFFAAVRHASELDAAGLTTS